MEKDLKPITEESEMWSQTFHGETCSHLLGDDATEKFMP